MMSYSEEDVKYPNPLLECSTMLKLFFHRLLCWRRKVLLNISFHGFMNNTFPEKKTHAEIFFPVCVCSAVVQIILGDLDIPNSLRFLSLMFVLHYNCQERDNYIIIIT